MLIVLVDDARAFPGSVTLGRLIGKQESLDVDLHPSHCMDVVELWSVIANIWYESATFPHRLNVEQ